MGPIRRVLAARVRGPPRPARIVQGVSNVDFEVEVKFESQVASRFQLQGILVEEDADDYLRLEVHHDGTTPRLFAASFAANSPTIQLNTPIPTGGSPIWLRLRRVQDDWTFSWSANGVGFTQAVTFTAPLNVIRIGPFAGNTGSPAPGFTASIDYFFNTASPILPEDGPDTTPPVLTAVSAAPTATSALVSWTTDEPATSRVEYGLTTGYGGQAVDMALSTDHRLTFGSLACSTSYHFRVTSADGASNSASSEDATFTTHPCPPPGAPVSDDFHADSLDASRWTFVNPLGDATLDATGTNILLGLPAGSTHDVWIDGNNSARIVQDVFNLDFEVEVKFESQVASRFQLQGILVEQDADDYLRLEVHHDGTTPRLFAASFAANSPTIQLNTPIPTGGSPIWLRVRRVQDDWTFSWSADGAGFTTPCRPSCRPSPPPRPPARPWCPGRLTSQRPAASSTVSRPTTAPRSTIRPSPRATP